MTEPMSAADGVDLYERLAERGPAQPEKGMAETITATIETTDEDRGALEAGSTGLPLR